MGWFIGIAGVLLFIGGVAVAIVHFAEEYGRDSYGRRTAPEPYVFPVWRRILGAVLALGGVVAFSVGISLTTVDARSVGIETKGGKYVGIIPPGRHLVAPWADVEQWSTRNQTLRFDEGGEDRDNYDDQNKINVKTATGGEAYVEATITWSIGASTVAGGADITDAQKQQVRDLWAQYKSFGDMRRDFIAAQAQTAASDIFGAYDPLSQLRTSAGADDKAKTTGVGVTLKPTSSWSAELTETLRPRYAARGITLVSAQVTRVDFDKATTDRINEVNAEAAKTAAAAQKVATANQEALAAKTRAATAPTDCLSVLQALADKDQLKNLPAGWQCPGTQGGQVIVGGQK